MNKLTKHLAPVLVVAAVAALAVPAAALSQAPEAFDYIANPGLSQAQYETRRDSFRVPMDDGAELYVEVERPDAEGKFPVIAHISPYHGDGVRTGSSSLPWPTATQCDVAHPVSGCVFDHEDGIGLGAYFAPRGYAVAYVDPRGTGRSGGCLDMLAARDAADVKAIVEWLASREWSSGRVGTIGMSYPGVAAAFAAAQRPEGLVTAVPIAAITSMYDHQFHGGVPYYGSWGGPVKGYATTSTVRHLPPLPGPLDYPLDYLQAHPGDDFGRAPQDAACGWASSAALAGGDSPVSGQYTAWHAARDFRAAAVAAPIPLFVVHGTNDPAARPLGMRWFFERDGSQPDKLWFGDWAHEAPRAAQWTYALHAWFDKHLQQRAVETGPSVEVFLPNVFGTDDGVYATDRWAQPASEIVAYPDGEALAPVAGAAGERSFTGSAFGGNNTIKIYETTTGLDSRTLGTLEFTGEPVAEGTMLLGEPALRLVASSTSPKTHLVATLYDQAPNGERVPVTTFALNPELRAGVDAPRPVVPGEKMTLRPLGFPVAHFLRPGHGLVLVVSTTSSQYYPMYSTNPRVTVYTGPGETELKLPVLDDPARAVDDVPQLP
ncbi:MAG TPA: CocE/NonD family hydrolase [Actinomycetota bacterium]|nr:CocE/NonD family hydrolase [Actinomycetota bacterium]